MNSGGTKITEVSQIWLKMEVEFYSNFLNKQNNKFIAYHCDDSFWWIWDDRVKCNRGGANNDICWVWL